MAIVYASPEYVSTLDTSTPASAHVAGRLRAAGLPARQAPAARGHHRLPATTAGPRSRRTACASSASARGNVCVMVAHGTPCLGPGDARRLRRAVPELPPRLLRLLRPDGGAEPGLARPTTSALERARVGACSAPSTPARRRSARPMAERRIGRGPARPRRGRGRPARPPARRPGRGRAAARSSSRRGSSRRSCAAGSFTEVPDITARICGICPVAYQMSSVAAMEDLCGVDAPEPVRALRRLLYCGEWIESHALHVFFLHGARLPRLRQRVRDGARPPRDRRARAAAQEGGQRADAGRRRPRDPPGQRARRRLLPRPRARPSSPPSRRSSTWRASSRSRRWPGRRPALPRARGGLRVRRAARARHLRDRARAAGLQRRARPRARASSSEHFAEHQVPHSTALHSRLRDGGRTSRGRSPATR